RSEDVVTAGVDTVISFIEGLGRNSIRLANGAGEVIVDFLRGIENWIRTHGYRIRNAAAGIADAILDGIKDTIVEGVAGMVDVFEFLVNKIVDGVKDFLGISSPSRVFMEIGEYMVAGLAAGVDDHDSVNRSMRDLGHDAVKG